ncbi:MAG TPA: L-2-amino-thiazoline-4-carboxylic acid hydrolase [Desulfosporosinus sp.]|nr:L-2-amino-thiazoline-4-carboxylic acid hydrolase [Desulfosporosinus sp.]
MSVITNNSTIDEKNILEIRNAIEHRATWMSLLMDEARNSGLDWDDFARKAIFRTGCFHGKDKAAKCTDISDLKKFAEVFPGETGKKIFEMDVTELSDDKLSLEFHYCPLVSAWIKQGFSDEDIAKLCDIAMDGDRGIASNFPDFQFELGKRIAQGDAVCEINFIKKK